MYRVELMPMIPAVFKGIAANKREWVVLLREYVYTDDIEPCVVIANGSTAGATEQV